jgi:membrane-bound lytic murein transglycosylase B
MQFAAAFLRRHPKAAPRAAVGAIVAGSLLFVIANLTTPLALANISAPRSRPARIQPMDAPPLMWSVDPAAPTVKKVLKRNPTHVKRQAPVSHGVISGLAANGIPQVALNAYRVAAARMGSVAPFCGIDWALLAGIGREESDHGQFGGAVLHADGVSTPMIIGPALDGIHWDYIPAPANGRALDGDAKYAHALGPMQFIPQTWAIYGTDGNGDGAADVFNINDAALGAARYLCAAGGNLHTQAGQTQAVLAYNHSDQYLAQVLALADAYRRGISITGIPVGITTGPLPTITNTGYIPPANPGAPTAVQKHKHKKKRATPKSSSSASGSRTPTRTAGSGTKTSAAPSGSSTASPTPTKSGTGATPTPSPTCGPLRHLLHQC